MRIRLDGTHAEITRTLARLRELFTLSAVCGPHAKRPAKSTGYRITLDIHPRTDRATR